MRLALAFASARYLTKPAIREAFRKGLEDLPEEVVLYWFTLCFYGYRQQAGRAALRTLLTYEQPEDAPDEAAGGRKRKARKADMGPDLFGSMDPGQAGNNGQGKDEKSKRGGGKKPRERTTH